LSSDSFKFSVLTELILAPDHEFVALGSEAVFASGPNGCMILQDAAVCFLIRSLAEGEPFSVAICELERAYGPVVARKRLDTAIRHGLLVDATRVTVATKPDSGDPGHHSLDALDQCKVFVEHCDATTRQGVAGALQAAGFIVVDDISQSDLVVVPVRDYLDEALVAANRSRLQDLKQWIPIKARGKVPLIGPFLRPGSGPCWLCVRERLQRNMPVEQFIGSHPDARLIKAPDTDNPLAHRQALDLCLQELRNANAAGRDATGDQIVSIDLAKRAIQRHPVNRLPQCRFCGDVGLCAKQRAWSQGGRAEHPLAVSQSPGDHDPVASAGIARFVDPLTGVVQRIEMQRDERSGLFICLASHNIDPAPSTLKELKASLSHASAGRGATAERAMRGALGEAFERHSTVFQGCEERISTSFNRLGPKAIDPRECMLFSRAQYGAAEPSGTDPSSPEFIPGRFDPSAMIEWSPVQAAFSDETFYLPTALLYTYYSGNGQGLVATSNGVAAGGSRRNAFVRAFMELVERDCASIWWYNKLPRPSVDIDPELRARLDPMLAGLARSGCLVSLLDIANDLGVPAVAAIAQWTVDGAERVHIGTSADFDRSCAILGAVEELCVGVHFEEVSGIARRRGAQLSRIDRSFLRAHGRQTVDAADSELASLARQDPVEACRRVADSQGLETFVLDLTRPDIEVPVVRVIVPGLRPGFRRAALGRLYDVPVKLGWVEHKAREQDLNPVAFA
jgi:bacteriocin biosynthesis cyclodehydratase domain-containing protein